MSHPGPKRRTLPHSPPPWVRDDAVSFITIGCEPRRLNQLCQAATSAFVFNSFEFNRARGIWWPYLLLLMPDHLHALMVFAPDPGMRKAIEDWKHYVSRKGRVRWQRDFFDHRLRTPESLDEKAAYIRRNPVRAGLAETAEEWPYVRTWPTRLSFER